uniref:Uncharacterized protein n=1 Tax=Arundo donax TaxID=35708 RepID=A0A0A9F210_ARUDO
MRARQVPDDGHRAQGVRRNGAGRGRHEHARVQCHAARLLEGWGRRARGGAHDKDGRGWCALGSVLL